jgi:hypothetical protein
MRVCSAHRRRLKGTRVSKSALYLRMHGLAFRRLHIKVMISTIYLWLEDVELL